MHRPFAARLIAAGTIRNGTSLLPKRRISTAEDEPYDDVCDSTSSRYKLDRGHANATLKLRAGGSPARVKRKHRQRSARLFHKPGRLPLQGIPLGKLCRTSCAGATGREPAQPPHTQCCQKHGYSSIDVASSSRQYDFAPHKRNGRNYASLLDRLTRFLYLRLPTFSSADMLRPIDILLSPWILPSIGTITVSQHPFRTTAASLQHCSPGGRQYAAHPINPLMSGYCPLRVYYYRTSCN